MNEKDYQEQIKERLKQQYILSDEGKYCAYLLGAIDRANAKLSEAQATIDTHNEMIERQHSEIRRLNELLERNNCRMIALEEK